MSSKYRVKDILKDITKIFQDKIPRGAREAQLLLMFHLDVDELWLLTHRDVVVDNIDTLYEYVKRRLNNEPIEYITNKVSFYSEEFYIDDGALIPRPETELLIDEVIKNIHNIDTDITFVEVGIGSGIISIILARVFKNAKFIGVDISTKAIGVAKKNIKKFGLEDRIEVRLGSLLDNVKGHIDYLISNPPYIAKNIQLEPNLSFEPQNALFGGENGDEIINKLLDEVLNRDINFFTCEIGYDQKDRIASKLGAEISQNISFYRDLSNFNRGFTLRL